MAAAPYLYQGWGDPPNPQTVSQRTGIKWFTMAFVLSGGGCTPAWDGSRPLTGGVDADRRSTQIRAGGGDVIPSFGGWSGNKLGPNCSTPQALAGAYQTGDQRLRPQGDRHRHREHRRVRERHGPQTGSSTR